MSDVICNNVLHANKWIVENGLVELTWGNVSFYDRKTGLVYIKPSGVNLEKTQAKDISIVTISGEQKSGKKPSVDLETHLEIYKSFESANCVIHTHSKYATIFSQANKYIPCLGTTHADYFDGDIPCVPHTTQIETEKHYEKNTGLNIVKYYLHNNIEASRVSSCIVKNHGVFTWGDSIDSALEKSKVVELVAEMAYKTILINSDSRIEKFIISKHFNRKHGENKSYGQ